jgi:hypothetical protein
MVPFLKNEPIYSKNLAKYNRGIILYDSIFESLNPPLLDVCPQNIQKLYFCSHTIYN